ncbi:MAG: TIGR02996 domain-containing protein [Kofleriaceae bacterium]
MTRERELRQAIIDSPDDVSLRLIYADYLQELGDVRGEYMALACNRAHETVASEMRRRALWQHYGAEWKANDAGPTAEYVYYTNGWCSSVLARPSELEALTPKLLDQPLDRIRTLTTDESLEDLVANPLLPRLSGLALSTRRPDPPTHSAVFNAASKITDLALSNYGVSDPWETLERCDRLDEIETLELEHVTFDIERARWLATHLPNVKWLELSNARFAPGALLALGERMPALDALSLRIDDEVDDNIEPPDHDEVARALSAPWLHRITSLNVTGISLNPTAIRAIANYASTLTALEFTTHEIHSCTDLGFRDWPELITLDVGNIDTFDLARCPKLESLFLAWTDDVQKHIVDRAPQLTGLNLGDVSDRGIRALAALPLDYLSLDSSTVTPEAIASIGQMEKLRRVYLRMPQAASVLTALANAPWPYIETLAFRDLPREAVRDELLHGWIAEDKSYQISFERRLDLSGTPVPNR